MMKTVLKSTEQDYVKGSYQERLKFEITYASFVYSISKFGIRRYILEKSVLKSNSPQCYNLADDVHAPLCSLNFTFV